MRTDLFLIAGDSFLRAQKIKALTAEIEKGKKAPLARQTYDLGESSLEEILSAARTLPFFSSGQIFCIQSAGSLKSADLAVLGAYLEHPSQGTTLIFEAEEIKGVSELQKIVKARGQVIPLAKEEARGAGASFIQQKLAQHGKVMTPGAKAKLLAMCGEAVVFLDTMIERIVQFSGDRREIDEAMVLKFEENWSEMDVFKLTGALVDRDPARALQVFRDLMGLYEADLVSLVGILHWQLRQLWEAATLLRSGISEREICSKLRMPPARLAALKRFPTERLEAAVEALYQIDKKSKTGQIEGVPGVEAWLLEYAS